MLSHRAVSRIAVVDDDDLSRRGIVAILSEDDRFAVTAHLTHDEALQRSDWQDVDVALVDAADTRRDDDMLPGVAVVEAIRAARSVDETTIIVITGHFFEDAIRLRMSEAAADLFFHRNELQDANRLCEVLADPSSVRRSIPALSDPAEMFDVGVSEHTKVNEAVRFAQEVGWLDGSIRRTGRRSRADNRLRRAFRAQSGINVVNRDGTRPDREQQDPSRTQIARFLDRVTRIKP